MTEHPQCQNSHELLVCHRLCPTLVRGHSCQLQSAASPGCGCASAPVVASDSDSACGLHQDPLPEAACRSTGCFAAAASGVTSAGESAAALAARLADFFDSRAFLCACLAPLASDSPASSSYMLTARAMHWTPHGPPWQRWSNVYRGMPISMMAGNHAPSVRTSNTSTAHHEQLRHVICCSCRC